MPTYWDRSDSWWESSRTRYRCLRVREGGNHGKDKLFFRTRSGTKLNGKGGESGERVKSEQKRRERGGGGAGARLDRQTWLCP